jgi:hypothetical protein
MLMDEFPNILARVCPQEEGHVIAEEDILKAFSELEELRQKRRRN